MDQADILQGIAADLKAAADPEFQARQQGYSKEPIQSLGVRTGTVRDIGKLHFAAVKDLPLAQFLELCTALLEVGTVEHRCIAFAWAYRRRKSLSLDHFDLLFHWLERYVDNWMACDQLCGEVFGEYLMRFPQFAPLVLDWARADNRWLRRAASVVLIPELRKTAQFFPILIDVATILLPDRDDLVQKGYGWALKESMDLCPEAAYQFVLDHKASMPRTALRYAIEKLSPSQKALAMQPSIISPQHDTVTRN